MKDVHKEGFMYFFCARIVVFGCLWDFFFGIRFVSVVGAGPSAH